MKKTRKKTSLTKQESVLYYGVDQLTSKQPVLKSDIDQPITPEAMLGEEGSTEYVYFSAVDSYRTAVKWPKPDQISIDEKVRMQTFDFFNRKSGFFLFQMGMLITTDFNPLDPEPLSLRTKEIDNFINEIAKRIATIVSQKKPLNADVIPPLLNKILPPRASELSFTLYFNTLRNTGEVKTYDNMRNCEGILYSCKPPGQQAYRQIEPNRFYYLITPNMISRIYREEDTVEQGGKIKKSNYVTEELVRISGPSTYPFFKNEFFSSELQLQIADILKAEERGGQLNSAILKLLDGQFLPANPDYLRPLLGFLSNQASVYNSFVISIGSHSVVINISLPESIFYSTYDIEDHRYSFKPITENCLILTPSKIYVFVPTEEDLLFLKTIPEQDNQKFYSNFRDLKPNDFIQREAKERVSGVIVGYLDSRLENVTINKTLLCIPWGNRIFSPTKDRLDSISTKAQTSIIKENLPDAIFRIFRCDTVKLLSEDKLDNKSEDKIERSQLRSPFYVLDQVEESRRQLERIWESKAVAPWRPWVSRLLPFQQALEGKMIDPEVPLGPTYQLLQKLNLLDLISQDPKLRDKAIWILRRAFKNVQLRESIELKDEDIQEIQSQLSKLPQKSRSRVTWPELFRTCHPDAHYFVPRYVVEFQTNFKEHAKKMRHFQNIPLDRELSDKTKGRLVDWTGSAAVMTHIQEEGSSTLDTLREFCYFNRSGPLPIEISLKVILSPVYSEKVNLRTMKENEELLLKKLCQEVFAGRAQWMGSTRDFFERLLISAPFNQFDGSIILCITYKKFNQQQAKAKPEDKQEVKQENKEVFERLLVSVGNCGAYTESEDKEKGQDLYLFGSKYEPNYQPVTLKSLGKMDPGASAWDILTNPRANRHHEAINIKVLHDPEIKLLMFSGTVPDKSQIIIRTDGVSPVHKLVTLTPYIPPSIDSFDKLQDHLKSTRSNFLDLISHRNIKSAWRKIESSLTKELKASIPAENANLFHWRGALLSSRDAAFFNLLKKINELLRTIILRDSEFKNIDKIGEDLTEDEIGVVTRLFDYAAEDVVRIRAEDSDVADDEKAPRKKSGAVEVDDEEEIDGEVEEQKQEQEQPEQDVGSWGWIQSKYFMFFRAGEVVIDSIAIADCPSQRIQNPTVPEWSLSLADNYTKKLASRIDNHSADERFVKERRAALYEIQVFVRLLCLTQPKHRVDVIADKFNGLDGDSFVGFWNEFARCYITFERPDLNYLLARDIEKEVFIRMIKTSVLDLRGRSQSSSSSSFGYAGSRDQQPTPPSEPSFLGFFM